jgi:hypothetical protein
MKVVLIFDMNIQSIRPFYLVKQQATIWRSTFNGAGYERGFAPELSLSNDLRAMPTKVAARDGGSLCPAMRTKRICDGFIAPVAWFAGIKKGWCFSTPTLESAS